MSMRRHIHFFKYLINHYSYLHLKKFPPIPATVELLLIKRGLFILPLHIFQLFLFQLLYYHNSYQFNQLSTLEALHFDKQSLFRVKPSINNKYSRTKYMYFSSLNRFLPLICSFRKKKFLSFSKINRSLHFENYDNN